jgi:hypothetical protein
MKMQFTYIKYKRKEIKDKLQQSLKNIIQINK